MAFITWRGDNKHEYGINTKRIESCDFDDTTLSLKITMNDGSEVLVNPSDGAAGSARGIWEQIQEELHTEGYGRKRFARRHRNPSSTVANRVGDEISGKLSSFVDRLHDSLTKLENPLQTVPHTEKTHNQEYTPSLPGTITGMAAIRKRLDQWCGQHTTPSYFLLTGIAESVTYALDRSDEWRATIDNFRAAVVNFAGTLVESGFDVKVTDDPVRDLNNLATVMLMAYGGEKKRADDLAEEKVNNYTGYDPMSLGWPEVWCVYASAFGRLQSQAYVPNEAAARSVADLIAGKTVIRCVFKRPV